MSPQTTLLERTTSGVSVEVSWLPTMQLTVLRVSTPSYPEGIARTVPGDRVKDAFDHPMAYLDDLHIDRLFPEGA